ncbi:MAG TPA: hypothetical protein H9858_02035 [Candidatus Blautia stercoravium]|nr:hypothetical protein [Candidatus Blautia stercoravium]
MDTELLNEICKRVKEKLQDVQLPSILVLTEEHGTICHETLENTELGRYYHMECALLADYQCCVKDCEAVVLYTLSNEALGKVTHGIFDNGFTRLLGQAILEGKKIYAAEEGIELCRYRNTAPKAFYGCLETNLQLLKDSGLVIAPHEQIPDLILHGTATETAGSGETAEYCPKETEKMPECSHTEPGRCTAEDSTEELREAVLDKKIITEKDMISLGNQRIKQVIIREKSILSDLAKEYAAKHKIIIERRDISSGKREKRL